MSQSHLPPHDPALSDKQQGLYNKFNVTRTDGKVKEGADYFVLDVANDPHARPALGAYIRSCHQDYPQLAADIEQRYLGGRTIDVPAPLPETADTFRTRDYHKRRVTYDDLIKVGLARTVALQFLGVDPAEYDDLSGVSISWPNLVLKDGMTALAVLSPEELNAITLELRKGGAPGIPLKTPHQIAHFLFAASDGFCPQNEWADRSLQSTVAACLLIKLAQEAWQPVALAKAGGA